MAHVEQKSYCKALFEGKIEEDLVFPFPHLEGEERENLNMVIDSVAKFCRDRIKPEVIDKGKKIHQEVMRGLSELGLMGMIIPEAYGGFSLSQRGYCRVIEELSRCSASVAVTVGGHQSIGLKALILYGTEEQKKKYLPKLATGEWIAAFCLTEPGAGSDAQSQKTTAVRKGDHYILNGSKQWVTNGGIAHLFTVFAQTEVLVKGVKKNRISAFIVTRDLPGITIGPEEKKMGIRGSSTTPVIFENVKVPAENLVGEEGNGFKVAMEILNSGRLGLASGCVGAARTMIQSSVAHAMQREQFGKKISEFEMIQEKIARMTVNTYAMESVTYMTAGLADRGDVDFSLESATSKVFCTERVWEVINDALQIMGGNGYMEEYPHERFLRDARINMIFEGTNEILRLFIALSGLQRPGEVLKEVAKAIQDPLHNVGQLADYAVKKITSLAGDRITLAEHVLEDEYSRVEEYTRHLAEVAEKVIRRHKKKIVEKEFVLERIAEMVMDLYVMTCVISRVSTSIRKNGAEKAGPEVDICRTFCNFAWRRIRRNSRMIDRNDDEILTDIAAVTLERGIYPF
ncbi:MAG: acyl-CoA dehydrogenase family protein [bacterium]